MVSADIDKIKPGMILAKAVYNRQDSLLLDAGAKLTEKSIRMLKSWGVRSVWIQGQSPVTENQKSSSKSASASEIEMGLAEKFADVRDDPVMLEIMRAASRVLSKRVQEQVDEP
jgi:hypothetical protein